MIYNDALYVIVVNLTRSTMIEAKKFSMIIEEMIIPGNNKLVIDLG
jgi:hypothetical protein